jgi:type I restriction enzyme, S subunit
MGNSVYRLGDGCSIEHGYAFSGMTESNDNALPIVVNIGNFQYTGGFRFDATRIQRYDGDVSERFRLTPGEILLVMTCQTAGGEILGIPGRIPDDGRTYLHNQRLGKVLVTRPDELDAGYLYYLFLSRPFNAHLVATATGAKIQHTAPRRIEDFCWHRPPIAQQRRIADVLSAYDDLIDNNTKRIKILEEMARSLYQEWFVEFRFPGRRRAPLVDSKLGRVPKGWAIGELRTRLQVHRGRSYKGTELAEAGGVPFVNLKCFVRDGGFRRDGLKRYTGEWKATQMVRTGDIVMA